MNDKFNPDKPVDDLRYSDEIYSILEKLGFSPESITKDESSILNKIEGLKKIGFENPIELIQKMPRILGYAEESMGRKIEWLKEQGFENPIELIQKMPPILGLAEESMGKKIEWLKGQGFENPIELIQKMPRILGYAEESMGRKIEYIKNCINLFSDNLNENTQKLVIGYIESIPNIFSIKFDRLAILIRILTIFNNQNKLQINSDSKRLTYLNIENLILALEKTKNNKDLTFPEFIKIVRIVKNENSEKAEKQAKISELMNEIQNSKLGGEEINENLLKILKRYNRGYLQ
ncbi:MAG: hypothetical protein WCC74_02475 [Minisyncoccia bacterium]